MNRRMAGAGGMRRDIRGSSRAPTSGPPSLMLDGLPAPLAAWGTTRMLTAYTDPILRVHDGTNNHDVDSTDEIAAACGANAGRISTWYDQSGAFDLTEGTNRPLIYDGASLIVNGTNVSVQFDGSNDKLGRADALGLTGAPALTIAYMMKRSGDRMAWSFGKASPASAGDACYSQDNDASTTRVSFGGFGPFRRFTCSDRSNYRAYIFQIAAGANFTAATGWQSGNVLSQFDATAGTLNLSNERFRLGCYVADSFFTACEISHFIVWNSVLAGADLDALRASLLAIEAA